jgi:hypothetical protein
MLSFICIPPTFFRGLLFRHREWGYNIYLKKWFIAENNLVFVVLSINVISLETKLKTIKTVYPVGESFSILVSLYFIPALFGVGGMDVKVPEFEKLMHTSSNCELDSSLCSLELTLHFIPLL